MGGPAQNFHGVGIGPLSKILAVKTSAFFWGVGVKNFPNLQMDSIVELGDKELFGHPKNCSLTPNVP